MPANKYALLRYRIIHRCLTNRYRPYPDKEYLRQQCEEALYGTTDGTKLSVKTIERDMRDMREDDVLGFMAPITYSREHQGYYYADPEFDIDKKPLSEDEAEALVFAANTLFQFKDSALFHHYTFAIEKIFEQLHFYSGQSPEPETIVSFESVPYSRGTEHLPSFYRAIRQQRTIIFSHRKYTDNEVTVRTLDPYLLKEYRNRWYVIGHEKGKGRVQSFGLDRITELTVTGEWFGKDPGFDPEQYFRHAIGITEAGLKPEKVVLSFSPLQGHYLKSQPLHLTQQIITDSDTEFRISIEVFITFELIQLVLGYGDEVKVQGPVHLRDLVAGKLQKALRHYEM